MVKGRMDGKGEGEGWTVKGRGGGWTVKVIIPYFDTHAE